MTLKTFPLKTITCAHCGRKAETPAGGRGRRYCGEKACQNVDEKLRMRKKKARTA